MQVFVLSVCVDSMFVFSLSPFWLINDLCSNLMVVLVACKSFLLLTFKGK